RYDIILISKHTETERILKQVYHQDDTNDEQVKTSNIAFQNLESEDKIISSSYIYYNQQKVIFTLS
ncbi:4637_t:CDS:2, partial [Rhizophagus irregularis]